ncbi:MAG: hypothetical protein ABH877_02635 [bacterium]
MRPSERLAEAGAGEEERVETDLTVGSRRGKAAAWAIISDMALGRVSSSVATCEEEHAQRQLAIPDGAM